MALTNLEETVLKKAREEADGILGEANASAHAQFERETARLSDEHQRRVEAARIEAQNALDREVGAREAADRAKLLQLKNEIIEGVFRSAAQGVLNQPNDGYRQWLRAQLAKLPKNMPLEIVANSRDREAVAHLLKEVGAAQAKVGEKTASIQGGFLARGANVDLDYSLDALMGVLRESLAEDVAMRLFEEPTK